MCILTFWLTNVKGGDRGQESGVSSWSSELELESGGLGVRGQELELEFRVGEWSCRAKLAAERKSERADTAYSPRFREEKLPDADNKRAASTSCRP